MPSNVKSADKSVKTVKKVAKAAISPVVSAVSEKKAIVKKSTKVKEATVRTASTARKMTSMKLVDLAGKDAGAMQLPSEIFAAEINNALIAQAIRVFLANQREGSASTKTRGEVRGSTRKIYRQKGTGRARHGGIRAPIFVGGGIVFGPHPRDYSLKLSKKMKKKALFSALSARNAEHALTIVAGAEKMSPKTKEAAKTFANLSVADKKRVLFVVSDTAESVKKSTRNLPYITILPYAQLNTYDVVSAHAIVFMQEAAVKLEGHFLKGDN